MLNTFTLTTRDIPSAWFELIDAAFDHARVVTVEHGSYQGQKRLEFDFAMVHIRYPGMRPLIPDIPPHLQSRIQLPCDMEYIENEYLGYVMDDAPLKPNESYTYGTRIKPQMEAIIRRYKENGFGSNQECIAVATPEDITLDDPPCTPPGTFVLTDNGMLEIENIVPGMRVMTHTGNYQQVTKLHSRMFHGYLNRVTINGNMRSVELTGEHPIYSTRSVQCPYDCRLRCKSSCNKQYSNYNGNCYQMYKHYEHTWRPAQDINGDDFVVIPTNAGNEDHDKDEMFIMGSFIANGWYSKRDGLSFAVNKSKPHIQQAIIDKMKLVYNLDARIDENYVGCNRISFYSRKLASQYLNWFGEGARNKTIPSWFYKLNKESIEMFMNGWIDCGDGYRSKKTNAVSLCTTSKNLALFADYALRVMQKSPNIKEFTIKSTVIDGRQIKANGPGYKIEWTDTTYRQHHWYTDTHIACRVKSNIVIPYTGMVYNLEVETDESYIANGITVHNCLRQIDCRIFPWRSLHHDNYETQALHFYIYFRSWDLFNGFPANLAAIRLMQEFMASCIGVEAGEIIAMSKGLHIYDHVWDQAKLLTNRA